MSDVYERLRSRLDDLATGLPETEDKIEIRLLKRLFIEEEANVTNPLKPVLCLAPMQTTTQKTAWVALSPKRKPGKLFLKMKKPGW